MATVSVSSANAILSYLHEHAQLNDSKRRQLLQSLNIDEAVLAQLDARLSTAQYHGLWQQAQALTQDPAIGVHLGLSTSTEHMSLVASLWRHSDTAEQGFAHYAKYAALLNAGLDVRFEQGASHSHMRYTQLQADAYCIADMERTLILGALRARRLYGDDVQLTRVAFQHERPAYAELYDSIFNCPIDYGQPHCAMTFSNDYLQRIPREHNPYVLNALRGQADAWLSRIMQHATTKKVMSLLGAKWPLADFNVVDVAQRLNMSRQTLYRRLKSENQTFKDLLDQVRQSNAMARIRDSQLSLSELAYDLGFSEVSAFNRAFKRWTGESPSHYRQARLVTD